MLRSSVKAGGTPVINARVYLYLKGTTTPVSDAWDSETGGTQVTFVDSNSQGEIVCFIDTPKRIDLKITDNSDRAYKMGAVGELLTFADFTETVDVHEDPSDIALTANVVTLAGTQTITGAKTFEAITDFDAAVRFKTRPWVDVTHPDFGADPTGVADSTAAIAAAIASLPAYSGGVGGGLVFFPVGSYKTTATIALTSGVFLKGAGLRSSRIVANGDFATISTAGDGGSDPLASYCGVSDLFIQNQSSAANANALHLQQVSNFSAERVSFQALPAGGGIVRLRAVIVSLFQDLRVGGTAGADSGCLLESANNQVVFQKCSFTDSKSGLIALGGTALTIIGCHFESLAGGAIRNSSLWIDGVRSGVIKGCYFESCPTPGITVASSVSGATWAFDIGGNFMTNMSSPMIDASAGRFISFGSNEFIPGPNSVNANGLVLGANAQDCVAHPQYLTSGTGAAVSVNTAATRILLLSSGQTSHRHAAATDTSDVSIVSSDTWQRFLRQADGKMSWGDGTVSPDTNLYRSAADTLKTDDKFHVVGELELDGALNHDGTTAGFYGTAPVTKPTAYTQTYATADKTLAAYTPDTETAAYTGAADGEAKLTDLNALRVAYENLRAFTEDLAQQHNSLLDDLQLMGLIG